MKLRSEKTHQAGFGREAGQPRRHSGSMAQEDAGAAIQEVPPSASNVSSARMCATFCVITDATLVQLVTERNGRPRAGRCPLASDHAEEGRAAPQIGENFNEMLPVLRSVRSCFDSSGAIAAPSTPRRGKARRPEPCLCRMRRFWADASPSRSPGQAINDSGRSKGASPLPFCSSCLMVGAAEVTVPSAFPFHPEDRA